MGMHDSIASAREHGATAFWAVGMYDGVALAREHGALAVRQNRHARSRCTGERA
jgi:hypothetical protein